MINETSIKLFKQIRYSFTISLLLYYVLFFNLEKFLSTIVTVIIFSRKIGIFGLKIIRRIYVFEFCLDDSRPRREGHFPRRCGNVSASNLPHRGKCPSRRGRESSRQNSNTYILRIIFKPKIPILREKIITVTIVDKNFSKLKNNT
jgi:hypothetical protein